MIHLIKKIFSTIVFFFSLVNINAQSIYKCFESSNDSLFYEVMGNGTPVLFLSGGPGGAPASLQNIIDYVNKDHYTILLHQRGTGLSSNIKIDSASITLDQYIDDIDKLMQRENLSNFYIIGHSWGSMLGMEYMVRNPLKVKGLILIGAPGYSLDFVQSMNNEMFKRMTSNEMDSLKIYFESLNTISDSTQIMPIQEKISKLTLSKQFYDSSLLENLLSSGGMNMKVNTMMMNDLRVSKWNIKEELEKLNNPVVIINGDYDPIDQRYVMELNNSLKNGKLHFINNCGHYVWIEKPKELQSIIEEFFHEHKFN